MDCSPLSYVAPISSDARIRAYGFLWSHIVPRNDQYNMQRFFVTFPLSIDLILTDPDIVHQLTRVMRIVIGDKVVLFDGDGSETTYEIMTIAKKSLSLR